MIRSISRALLKEFFKKEKFDPEVSRALLVTIAIITPLIVAHQLGKPLLGILPGLTAQLLTSAKIEGTYLEKTFILFVGTLACSAAGFIGTLAGVHPLTAIIFLGLIAGLSSMARGISEYGQVFGISCVLIFLICLYPPNSTGNAIQHALVIGIGGVWAIIINLIVWQLSPNAFYMATAKPWYFSALLVKALSHPNWLRKNENWLSQTEIHHRKSINNILPWIRKKRKESSYIRRETLKLVRASSRLGATAITLHSELKVVFERKIPVNIQLKIKKTASSIGNAAEAITDTVLNGFKDDPKKIRNMISKATNAVQNLVASLEKEKLENEQWIKLLHIVSLFESSLQYLHDALLMLRRIEESKKPKEKIRSSNLKLRLKEVKRITSLQFLPDSLLLKHSLRVVIMTCIGLVVYFLLGMYKGYWIVLTIMILLQPEFGNTWEKARDRMAGTILGGLIGSFLLILSLSTHFVLPIIAIAISCFFFSYYQSKNYRVAVVFVTIMLVLMLDITEKVNWEIAAYRLLFTVIGGVLAVAGAYLLWPNWETLQFPFRIAKAFEANKNYLLQIEHEIMTQSGFHPRVIADRRKAEIENINVETSLKTMRMEPYRIRNKVKNAEKIAAYNKTLTRELTSFASSLPELKGSSNYPEAYELIELCVIILNTLSKGINKGESKKLINELEMTSLVLDAKLEVLKDNLDSEGESNIATKESVLIPYQIIAAELKKITEPIKALVELSDEAVITG